MPNGNIVNKSPYVLDLDAGTHLWCSCGRSTKEPFCDLNTHKSLAFAPKKIELTEKKKVALCGCRQTKNPPYCDGSHAKL
jgi:CDGSH-type Zn-finger protein